MAIDLFDACDPASDGDDSFSKIEIDKEFARRLEHNKKREALQKYEELKKKGRVAASDDSDNESSDDDFDDLAGSPRKDLQFLKTLVRVKKNDPEILQKDAKIYPSDEDDDESEESNKLKGAKKERALYLKDVMAQHLIEEGPEFGETSVKYDRKVYNKEQEEGLKAFLQADKEAFGSDEDGDVIKEKETGLEVAEDEDVLKVNENLDEFFGKDDELSDNEKFLKDYLRNRRWADKQEEKRLSLEDFCEVSEDEDELEKQDKYEAEYNFRHEEGQDDRVWGHSRVIEGSVRKKTSNRQQQRKSKEERMAQAELERKEELKHLKNLKKKEIQEKLEKIRAVAGLGEDVLCKLGAEDLEEDFDPEEYDKKMKETFDEDYYGAEDANPDFGSYAEGELEKPDFDKEDELLGLPKDWDVGSGEGFKATRERVLKHKEEAEPSNEEGKRKRKRKMSLKEKVELDKELEEYYKLDYEDTIGDLKTRFKYKSVPPNRYGLHSEEILMANDKDLNQYVSMKKLAPYRQNEWKVTYHQKLKKSLILQGVKSDGKTTGKKSGSMVGPSVEQAKGKQRAEQEESNGEQQLSRRIRRRRRQAELKLSRSRLMAYGKIPSKP
ncbi:uncharacterized protein [Typha angustifolia]|uniref:uncharacterized protein n=1 Tax=Typha angustifolia TaxID=59011 RepID=UPI003C2CCD8E